MNCKRIRKGYGLGNVIISLNEFCFSKKENLFRMKENKINFLLALERKGK